MQSLFQLDMEGKHLMVAMTEQHTYVAAHVLPDVCYWYPVTDDEAIELMLRFEEQHERHSKNNNQR